MMAAATDTCQALFEQRWGHLHEPHVRALAWLLDAPDLLDPDDPHWDHKVASIGPLPDSVAGWLAALDADPAPLLAALADRAYTRLGLYAEKLMAFYYGAHGRLVAHGLQVRASRNDTIGEFDFLLDAGPAALEHIEFATKFYLLQGVAAARFDNFVGPNLADSLGAKMRKIFERQLALGSHPAAQAILPRPVVLARALVKGWLFYPLGAPPLENGIGPRHCRGFWCALAELDQLPDARYAVLPRMQWLAPYKAQVDGQVLERAALQARLAGLATPVQVARVVEQGGYAIEVERGFVVPDDWRERARAWQR
jgi:hypothetical protein